MKRRTFITVIAVILTILLADCLVYSYFHRIFQLLNNRTLSIILTILYWMVLPLLIASSFYIWKKYHRLQSPLFSGKIFRVAGLFIQVYIPKIILAAIIVLNLSLKVGYRLSSMAANSVHQDSNSFMNGRLFALIPAGGLCISIIVFGIILYGITSGRFRFKVSRISLDLRNLSCSFDGLKIIHISDLHTGSLYRNIKKFDKVVNLINNEKPDLIFFTGDIVNEFAGELDGWEGFLSGLDAKYGKFSVPGNHDYGDYYPWKSNEDKEINFRKIIDFEKRMGFRVLLNESVPVKINNQEVSIMGVENWGLKMFTRYGKLEKAMEGMNPDSFKILLSHDPSHWDAEISGKTTIDLTFSGHTHGFQFGIRTRWFKWSPVQKIYPRWEGLHQEGDQYLYVNTGLGYIGFPGRIGIPPEIAVIKLHSV